MLMPAKGVENLKQRWCVLKPDADLADQKVGDSVSYACGQADCTSLGYKTSCDGLDPRGNVSYAFNSYYQSKGRAAGTCDFAGAAYVVNQAPSKSSRRSSPSRAFPIPQQKIVPFS